MAIRDADWNNRDNWLGTEYIGPQIELKTAGELGAHALGYSQAINDAIKEISLRAIDKGIIGILEEMKRNNGA